MRRQPLGLLFFLTLLVALLMQSGCAALSTSTGSANAHPNPSIIIQPTSRTVTAGQTATFTVVASGTSPFSYQWWKNGTVVRDATSSSYTSPAESMSDSGAHFSVVVSNSAGSATSGTAILTVNAAPPGASLQIATSSFPTAEVGIQFQADLSATGGVQPYHWSVVSGKLPPALSLNPNTGAFSGVASQDGQFDFSVQVSDSSSPKHQTSMKALFLSVVLALQIAPGGLPNAQVGVPYEASFSGSGGTLPYTWNIGGAPAPGLSLNPTSGVIAGTPTQAETSTFTVVLTDSVGQTAQKPSSLAIAATALSASGHQVVITPSVPPVVNQGQTTRFTCSVVGGGGCTWTCPSCAGSIDSSTGVYTAPSTVNAADSFGGYQLLPNDSIFNTRIDSLPVNSNSATWISGAGAVPVNYIPSFEFNYVNGSTPTTSEKFLYTPSNNGAFQFPTYPNAKIENGWLFMLNSPYGSDHHLWTIDTTNGMFQELYDPSTPTQCNAYAGGSPNCTALSGVRYSSSTYALPVSGATDAAGMYVMPLSLHLQEMVNAVATSGTIKHALRFTLQNGYILGTGATRHIWPATAEAFLGGGVVPYGARFRLKASFDISGYSAIAQILLTQMKQYGIILADGGYGWQITTDYANWPANIYAAFNEVGNGRIVPSDFEAVDESGLMLSSSSDATTSSETVVATSISFPSASASQQVALTGVTLGLDRDFLYAQAGASTIHINAYVNGSSNKGVTWSMSPSVGTLGSGGLYTPPPRSASEQTTTITATSAANSRVVATIPVTIFPSGTIRIVSGQTTNYTDASGNVWLAGGFCCGGTDGGYPSANDYGGLWPILPNILLYEVPFYSYYSTNDIRFDIYMPNGNYSVTGKFAAVRVNGPGKQLESLEVDGAVVYPNLDFYALAGYQQPIDFTLPATVTNGELSFVIRQMGGSFTDISALQIAPGP